jgi:ribose transport system substrate-binding protein
MRIDQPLLRRQAVWVLLCAAILVGGCVSMPPNRLLSGPRIVVIGKSMNPYWTSVERGVHAAGKDLGIETALFVPPQEDVAAQIQIMETQIAKGVTGIAIAPSNPEALEPIIRRAVAAGIIVTTLDTPPVKDSVSAAYIGTDNLAAGRIAGETMALLLPEGGKIGIVRGSDTALNALQRTEGFIDALDSPAFQVLPPLNDREDAAAALQLSTSLLLTHPELAGAYGVYAYNGPAWAKAIAEAKAQREIKVVCFDATSDSINGIKTGSIDAVIAQREYDMGYKSVAVIAAIKSRGEDTALSELGATNGVISTGVDVVTADNLKQYEADLDTRGIPHEWTAQGSNPR